MALLAVLLRNWRSVIIVGVVLVVSVLVLHVRALKAEAELLRRENEQLEETLRTIRAEVKRTEAAVSNLLRRQREAEVQYRRQQDKLEALIREDKSVADYLGTPVPDRLRAWSKARGGPESAGGAVGAVPDPKDRVEDHKGHSG